MATTSRFFMYSLTLKPPTAITQAIAGHFSGTREQQILTASGGRLTLHRAELRQGNFAPILSHDVFGIIRGLAGFRLAGGSKDYIVVSSDSGRITVMEYNPETNQFVRVHQETFGKSGVRRVVPGQYLAADPRGRAVMMASVEKNKIVYILNRNPQAELTISSPLEAFKPQTLTFDLIGLDVGYDNPIFASLEVDASDSDQDPTDDSFNKIEKQLVYYELDLGLNHVVKKWSENVERSANLLLPVPGGTEGPSGVIVCGEESISYRHSNQEPQRLIIPRRRGATEDPDRKRHIIAGVMHKTKAAQSGFFFLLQTEDGDLFRLTINLVKDSSGAPTGLVKELNLQYFDTIPVASSLVVLRSGFLFAACESGDHQMYQFEKLGSDDPEATWSSSNYLTDWTKPYEPVYFHPRDYENLILIESIDTMHPQIKSSIVNLTEDDAPQIYTVCGSGARSSLKTLKHGLEVSELAESELPSMPEAVWSIKKNVNDAYDSYIVLSFRNGSLVLRIGETVEEVSDSGLLTTGPTIAMQLLGEDSIVQVFQRGVRHVHKGGHVTDWPCPQHRTIVAAATNEQQVVVALSSGELVYFELDSDGTLGEFEERREMSGTITAVSIGDIPEGRQRSHFLAVGCDDSTVRILSLHPDSTLESMSVQALTAAPSSLRMMSMVDSTSGNSTLYLHMGLWSGVYIRTVVDDITGQLSDTRSRFLGPKPIRLFPVTVKHRRSMVALSSRPWLVYNDPTTLNIMLTPLLYVPLEYASNFSSEECPEGMVGIEENRLRVFNVTKINSNLFTESIPLAHTPRFFTRHPALPYFYVAESDANALSADTKRKLLSASNLTNGDAKELPPATFGYSKGQGHWASCIQVVDPVNEKQVVYSIELDNNEAATAIAAVPFASQDGDVYIIVATGKDMVASPPSHDGGFLHVYQLDETGKTLTLVHKTKTDVPCRALIAFQGRVLAGIGKSLRLFDIGQRQLLRKAQGNVAPNLIVNIQTQGSRIIVSDVRESVIYCVFKPAQSLFLAFADDALARWSTTSTMVDYETTAGGDKFGNFWMLRCTDDASRVSDEDQSGAAVQTQRSYLQGTAHRLDTVAHFYTQDVPMSMQKTQLVSGGREVLMWTGLQGTIGLMIPFVSREDVDFFVSLEQHMRTHDSPLAGRDHLAFRGYYVPPKGVIDGDLCERFFRLTTEKKMLVAAEMERSVRELERKLSDIRARVAF